MSSSGIRIAVDALSQRIGGGLTVARRLVPAIAAAEPTWHLTLFASVPPFETAPPPNVEVIVTPELAARRRIVWQQARLPSVLRAGRFDLLLNLGGFAVARSPVPQISLWQNANPLSPQAIPARPRRFQAYFAVQRAAQGWSMRRTRANVFMTETSLHDAARIWPVERYAAVAIHLGLDLPPELPHAPREDFVLTVGHTFYHKNYETLIDAMARADSLKVLIAGGPAEDPAYHASLLRRAAASGAAKRMTFLGPTPAAAVLDLYRRARIYVTASLLESFGLTLLEAMAHGAPVAASHASCIPEVAGDAALYFNPHDPVDVAAVLVRLASDAALQEDLRRRGFARAQRFSWERCAREYVRLIARVLSTRESEPAV